MVWQNYLAAGLIVLLVMLGGKGQAASVQGPQPPLQTEIIIGRLDAPITIIEYSSLTCTHCAAFHNSVFPQLKEKYIDTGKIRFIFRPYPRDEYDLKACVAVGCVPAGASPAVLSKMMSTQNQWMSENFLPIVSQATNIEQSRLESLINDKNLQEAVIKKRLEAEKKYNIDATPAFLINGKIYVGVADFEHFEKILKAAYTS